MQQRTYDIAVKAQVRIKDGFVFHANKLNFSLNLNLLKNELSVK